MHPLNIMWLLNDVSVNNDIEIQYHRTKHIDYIEIIHPDFSFYITEYGDVVINYKHQGVQHDKDVEYWSMVKTWVKNYFNEVL